MALMGVEKHAASRGFLATVRLLFLLRQLKFLLRVFKSSLNELSYKSHFVAVCVILWRFTAKRTRSFPFWAVSVQMSPKLHTSYVRMCSPLLTADCCCAVCRVDQTNGPVTVCYEVPVAYHHIRARASGPAAWTCPPFARTQALIKSFAPWSIAMLTVDCSRPHQTSISLCFSSSMVWIFLRYTRRCMTAQIS